MARCLSTKADNARRLGLRLPIVNPVFTGLAVYPFFIHSLSPVYCASRTAALECAPVKP
jgi:hypothetical protein